jgi:hypothetical protein
VLEEAIHPTMQPVQCREAIVSSSVCLMESIPRLDLSKFLGQTRL